MAAETISLERRTAKQNCFVCFDPIEPTDLQETIKKCMHIVHKGCFDQWSNPSNPFRGECPQCHVKFKEEESLAFACHNGGVTQTYAEGEGEVATTERGDVVALARRDGAMAAATGNTTKSGKILAQATGKGSGKAVIEGCEADGDIEATVEGTGSGTVLIEGCKARGSIIAHSAGGSGRAQIIGGECGTAMSWSGPITPKQMKSILKDFFKQ